MKQRGAKISIHLMCRFDRHSLNFFLYFRKISIHLMCRFDCSLGNLVNKIDIFQYISCVGSIVYLSSSLFIVLSFQYILCVGSIPQKPFSFKLLDIFQYISCVGSILKSTTDFVFFILFQYISCVGSILKGPHKDYRVGDFNTSHVSVRFDISL